MARSPQDYEAAYDTILFAMWDMTTGMGGTSDEIKQNATIFAEFILSELARTKSLKLAEAAAVRRGLAMPRSLMCAWVWNVLDDLQGFDVAPTPTFCEMMYQLLGCTHLEQDLKLASDRNRALKLMEGGWGVRAVAARFGVNPSTASRWKKEGLKYPDREIDLDLRTEIIALTKADTFWQRTTSEKVLQSE